MLRQLRPSHLLVRSGSEQEAVAAAALAAEAADSDSPTQPHLVRAWAEGGLDLEANSASPIKYEPETTPVTQVAMLLQSSGVSGTYKPVQLTVGNLEAATRAGPGPIKSMYMRTSFAAISGTWLALLLLRNGGTYLFNAPPVDSSTTGTSSSVQGGPGPMAAVAHSYVAALAQHGPEAAALNPSLAYALLELPAGSVPPFPSVKTVIIGGTAMPGSLMAEIRAKLFPGALVVQAWSMTETCAGGTVCLPLPGLPNKDGSIGFPIAVDARIADKDTGATLERGTGPENTGELRVRGPTVCTGYWRNEAVTKEAFDGDGWLRTGDVGYMDEHGFTWLVGRSKEMFKCNGLQVAPAELDALLMTHPAVSDAIVVGKPDEKAGDQTGSPGGFGGARSHQGARERPGDAPQATS
jgi:acyl-CoA synthetase (AMP-forming)/AMP-acid ligase II